MKPFKKPFIHRSKRCASCGATVLPEPPNTTLCSDCQAMRRGNHKSRAARKAARVSIDKAKAERRGTWNSREPVHYTKRTVEIVGGRKGTV